MIISHKLVDRLDVALLGRMWVFHESVGLVGIPEAKHGISCHPGTCHPGATLKGSAEVTQAMFQKPRGPG